MDQIATLAIKSVAFNTISSHL